MSEEFMELFEQLYKDNYIKVYRLAFGLTHNFNDAEDITQEAFLRAFRSYKNYCKDSEFFTWMYRITVNVAKDYMRQRKKLPIYEIAEEKGCSVDDLADHHPDNNPEAKIMINEVMRICMAGFTECLPVNQRKVFLLSAGLGLSHKLIAEILDCSVNSVKTNLYRAKNKIISYMESRCRLIKESNPCRCEQWVKNVSSKKVIPKEWLDSPLPKIIIPNKVEIYIGDLRDIYKNVYLADNDDVLADFLKDGFAKRKWSTFS